jgi:hypothetical protein
MSYISNILPRIKQFSHDLDKKEIFIDSPWVIIDENQNQQKYIFRRNGELLMSLNGQVILGKWEYLSAAKCLLIDRTTDKVLFNQHYLDKTIMILGKDGIKNDRLILVNQLLLPSLDVLKYLKDVFYKSHYISTVQIKTGETLELHKYNGFFEGTIVTINSEAVLDGIVELVNSDKKLVIKDSKIDKILTRYTYKTKKGNLIIDQSDTSPRIGDDVYTEEYKLPPDGKYKLGFLYYIIVENGKIIG